MLLLGVVAVNLNFYSLANCKIMLMVAMLCLCHIAYSVSLLPCERLDRARRATSSPRSWAVVAIAADIRVVDAFPASSRSVGRGQGV